MYGYEIVELKNIGRNLRIRELPLITTFTVFLKGHPDDATFHIKLQAEGASKDEIELKLEHQRKNLKLYLNLITQKFVDVIQIDEPKINNEKIIYEENWQKTIELLQDTNISKFVTSRYTQQDIMLQLGLDEIFNNDLFNGFPKLVNWLDDKGRTLLVCLNSHLISLY